MCKVRHHHKLLDFEGGPMENCTTLQKALADYSLESKQQILYVCTGSQSQTYRTNDVEFCD